MDFTDKEGEDSHVQVLNLLDKIHSGSFDAHGADSSDDETGPADKPRLTDFSIGGHYPGFIGESILGRYVFVKRIGQGPYASCWMAKDCKLDMFVAVKIYKSSPAHKEIALQEAKVLLTLNKIQKTPKPFEELYKLTGLWEQDRVVVKFYNCCILPSSNGSHYTLILELLGPTLQNIIEEHKSSVAP